MSYLIFILVVSPVPTDVSNDISTLIFILNFLFTDIILVIHFLQGFRFWMILVFLTNSDERSLPSPESSNANS